MRLRERPALLLCLWLAAVSPAAAAGVELLLQDGQTLSGVDVRREGEVYLLEQEGGNVSVIPAPLVREVRLTGAAPAPDEPPPAAEPRAPTGFRTATAETVAGTHVEPPRTSDQLRVFGEPSSFSRGVIDPTWRPETDWETDPYKTNNWAPSKWADGVVDPSWHAESAFDPNADVLDGSRSAFRGDIVDSSWQPTDGFAK